MTLLLKCTAKAKAMPYPPPPPAEDAKTTAPIAFVQRLRNRASCLCCARCGSFAGNDAMVQCAAPSIPRDGASLADALKELNIKHRSHGVVFCGCGAVFCSEACLDDDEAHAMHWSSVPRRRYHETARRSPTH